MPSAVIIGAGIGGLTTAIGLREIGWRVRVLERWPEVVGIGAALGLWPQAREALGRIGLGEAVHARSVGAGAVTVFDRDGHRLLARGEDRGPDVRLISRRTLMELLVDRATGIDVRTGVGADAPVLRSLLAEHDLVIGADGVRSVVRQELFAAETRPRYSGLVGWRGTISGEYGGFAETWGAGPGGTGQLFGMTPMAPGLTNFYAAYPLPEDGVDTLADLRGRYENWHAPIPHVLAAVEDGDVLRNPIYDLAPALPTFVAGRAVLLGDAAHAMTPHVGRGACEALLDAVALVSELAAEPSVEEALAAYDARRREPAQRVAARSWRMRRVTHASGRRARLRDGALRLAGLVLR